MRLFALLFVPALFVGCGESASSSDPSAPATAGAPEAAAPKDIGTVLATVGDVKVGSVEFEEVASRRTPENGESLTIEERKDVLAKLVDEKALYQEARRRGIDQDPKVQKVMINTLLREEVYASVRNSDFTEEELKAYFESHADEFVVPEKVQVKRIFIKVSEQRTADDAKKAAEDVRAQLVKDPASFKDLAAKYSEDPYKRRGGDLGFVSRDGKPGIDPAVIEKSFTMKVGEISEVFDAGGGMNIITVANRREKVERTFEQMRGSVLRKVKNDKYKALYDEYVAKVKANYTVTIDEKALAEVKVTPAPAAPMAPGGMGMEGMDAHPRPGAPGSGIPGRDPMEDHDMGAEGEE
jgi:peptidyl-prolyl cis-trans isomerase C